MLPVAATLPFAAAAFRPEGPEPPQPPSAARPSLRSPTFASPGAWASQVQKGPRRVGSPTLRQRGPRAPLPLPPAGDENPCPSVWFRHFLHLWPVTHWRGVISYSANILLPTDFDL